MLYVASSLLLHFTSFFFLYFCFLCASFIICASTNCGVNRCGHFFFLLIINVRVLSVFLLLFFFFARLLKKQQKTVFFPCIAAALFNLVACVFLSICVGGGSLKGILYICEVKLHSVLSLLFFFFLNIIHVGDLPCRDEACNRLRNQTQKQKKKSETEGSFSLFSCRVRLLFFFHKLPCFNS